MKFAAVFASLGLLALVASCAQPPEARIAKACVDGGNTRQVCDCFVTNLRTNLTPEQMKVLADSTGQPRKAAKPNSRLSSRRNSSSA
jgi:hypothetical protein